LSDLTHLPCSRLCLFELTEKYQHIWPCIASLTSLPYLLYLNFYCHEFVLPQWSTSN
jgi:hypothetical protein